MMNWLRHRLRQWLELRPIPTRDEFTELRLLYLQAVNQSSTARTIALDDRARLDTLLDRLGVLATAGLDGTVTIVADGSDERAVLARQYINATTAMLLALDGQARMIEAMAKSAQKAQFAWRKEQCK